MTNDERQSAAATLRGYVDMALAALTFNGPAFQAGRELGRRVYLVEQAIIDYQDAVVGLHRQASDALRNVYTHPDRPVQLEKVEELHRRAKVLYQEYAHAAEGLNQFCREHGWTELCEIVPQSEEAA